MSRLTIFRCPPASMGKVATTLTHDFSHIPGQQAEDRNVDKPRSPVLLTEEAELGWAPSRQFRAFGCPRWPGRWSSVVRLRLVVGCFLAGDHWLPCSGVSCRLPAQPNPKQPHRPHEPTGDPSVPHAPILAGAAHTCHRSRPVSHPSPHCPGVDRLGGSSKLADGAFRAPGMPHRYKRAGRLVVKRDQTPETRKVSRLLIKTVEILGNLKRPGHIKRCTYTGLRRWSTTLSFSSKR
jgi:hypothetical protein